MNAAKPARRGYVRPMQGWWRRDKFFMNYMLRELTAVAVLVYSIILCVGVLRLAQGPAAYDGWLAALRSPGAILLHLVLLVSMAIHAHSWFVIMPKTLPMIFAGGKRVSAAAIIRIGLSAFVVATVLTLAIAGWLK